jgi:hypothetical protein
MCGACKTALGLCVALSLVLLYHLAMSGHVAKTESLTVDDIGDTPAQLVSGWNPFAGSEVRQAYLAGRGWDRPEARPTPIDNGDMRDSPNEISTVNNNVRAANGGDNKESFSSQELTNALRGHEGMWVGQSEGPQFWEPNPHLTLGSYIHSGEDSGSPENFTSEQLFSASRGRNAGNY